MEFKRKVWCVSGTLSRTFYGKLLPYVTCWVINWQKTVRRFQRSPADCKYWQWKWVRWNTSCWCCWLPRYLFGCDWYLNEFENIRSADLNLLHNDVSIDSILLMHSSMSYRLQRYFLIEAWCDAPVNHIGEAHVLIDIRHEHSAQAFLLLLCFSCGILCILFEH